MILAVLAAAGVARLDDRGEVSTGVLTLAPAEAPRPNLAAELKPEVPDQARVAVVPDKAGAQAEEWEAATAAAIELAEAQAAEAAAEAAVAAAEEAAHQPPTTTTVAPAAAPLAPAPTAAPAPAAPGPRPTEPDRPAPRPPSPRPPSPGPSLFAKLDNIARCESGMNPKAYNPAGPYLGAFQFHISTWRGLGEAGDPRNRSYSYQRDVAARLARAAGFRASWPSCSARYGY